MIEMEEILIFWRNIPTISAKLCTKHIVKGKFNANSASNLNIAKHKCLKTLYRIFYEDTFSNNRI
jgi:hypothetical protein